MKLLQVRNLKVHFPVYGGVFRRVIDYIKAVDGIDLTISAGQTYGLVGESGSGKTTTGRTIIGLNPMTSGQVLFEGQEIRRAGRGQRQRFYRDIQMIFQDPYSSLNPRKRVLDIVAEPLRNFERMSAGEEKRKVEMLISQVGLSPETIYKYPHEFSGGQRQRIGIARAIALKPKLIIADEPVSSLDVSVQAQVLNFMRDIQQELNLTYLFISHDLGVIRHMCDYIGIMYKGRLVETGTTREIFEDPQHIYTKRLLAAIPEADPTERETRQKFREMVQQEYEAEYESYFDAKGLPFTLQRLGETHYAALPKRGEGG